MWVSGLNRINKEVRRRTEAYKHIIATVGEKITVVPTCETNGKEKYPWKYLNGPSLKEKYVNDQNKHWKFEIRSGKHQ